MRFLHTADVHLGAVPDPGMPWSEERSQAIWNTFRTLVSIAGRQQTDLLLIAGDFFHRQPLRRECKEVNDLFASIPNTHVVIIAGSHDFIRDTSPYVTYPWCSNVTILSSQTMSSVVFDDINTVVHGLSYHAPEITEPLYDRLHAPRDGRIHILLGAGGDETHIPINLRRLAEAGFDYVALGHRTAPALSDRHPMAWSGSPEPIGREDIGRRGYISGTILPGNCQFHWYPCSFGQYQALSLNVTPETTCDQLAAMLTEQTAGETDILYRITLKGRRNPAVRPDIPALMTSGPIVDIIDETIPALDMEQLRTDHASDLISRYIDALTPDDPDTPAAARSRRALDLGLRALLFPEG